MSKGLRKKKNALKCIDKPVYRPLVEELLLRFEDDLTPDIQFTPIRSEEKKEQDMAANLEVSIAFLNRRRSHSAFFFYEMISRWLIPLKKVEVILFFSTDISVDGDTITREECHALHEEGSDRIYTIGEGVVQFKNSLDYELFVRHFPLIKQEMLLGMTSRYHSSKILEMKGLSVGEKAPLIHEKILNMSHHFPSFFDHGIFSLMQKYLVKVPDTYKKDHDSSDMVKTICSLYLLQKKLSDNIENAPQKRMAVIKYRFVNLQVPFGIKKVLGVTFGLTFLRKNERFSKDHLLKAVNSIMPGVTCIPSSFFSIEQEGGNASLFYLELEKSDPFTQEEKNKMQKELLRVALLRIEHLVKPVFMPRNEEEVMRNVLTLCSELQFVDDLPQVNTSFEKQTDKFLVFTVVLARVLRENNSSIKYELNKGVTSFSYSVDRVKEVGRLRDKYPKEATVIRAFLPDKKFIKEDQSVDLFQARQSLIKELRSILGDFRDYNGGMLSKQKEAFDGFVNELDRKEKKQMPLVEKFFHSIFPVEKRSLANPKEISFLFRMFLKMSNSKFEKKAIDTLGGAFYAFLSFEALEKAEAFLDKVSKCRPARRDVIKIQLHVYDKTYIGLIVSNAADEENVEILSLVSSLSL